MEYHSDYKRTNDLFDTNVRNIIEGSICVSKLGRVESVHLSPDKKRIAYASFDLNQIIVFEIEINDKKIELKDCIFVEGDLNGPHDFAWIDNSKIVVANRNGPAVIMTIDCSKSAQSLRQLNKTNSVAAINERSYIFCSVDNNVYCCNIDESLSLTSNKILFSQGLRVPDGVAISPSKKIAITSALTDSIIVFNFENNDQYVELKGVISPHSVEFIDDNYLISSGGNDPYINVWHIGDQKIAFKCRILNRHQYALRIKNTEGGIKGFCLHHESKVLFLTCPNAPFLAFDATILYDEIN